MANTGKIDPAQLGHEGSSVGMLLLFATNACVLVSLELGIRVCNAMVSHYPAEYFQLTKIYSPSLRFSSSKGSPYDGALPER